MPSNERPIEKMMRLGAERLSDEELLAILLGTGTRRENALQLAFQLSHSAPSKRWLLHATHGELMKISGIGQTKACRIIAGITLGKRLLEEQDFFEIRLSDPATVATYFRHRLSDEQREVLCIILLNVRLQPVETHIVSIGTLTEAKAHPREIFVSALRSGAASLILAHNHPSGDPEPSTEDVRLTRRLVRAGHILGVEVIDHIVVSANGYVSLKERQLM